MKKLAVDDAARVRLLDWGISNAQPLPSAEIGKLIKADNPAVKVEVWKRPGDAGGRGNSVLLQVTNTSDGPVAGTIKLDLKGLDVNVRQPWVEYADAVDMDGLGGVENRESAQQKRGDGICYNAYDGELYYTLQKGQSRVLSIDRY